ncbi:DUF4245 domain-containing protein [Actinoplanes sp. NBC_00393]|uniref:DUF4245 domain-containing protein n=1 Tax=Actinoplanes sp. NBC_00393 TaxID=2975953 RepID=UPI002E228A78
MFRSRSWGTRAGTAASSRHCGAGRSSDPGIRGRAKSRFSDMVNNGSVEPASPQQPQPADTPAPAGTAAPADAPLGSAAPAGAAPDSVAPAGVAAPAAGDAAAAGGATSAGAGPGQAAAQPRLAAREGRRPRDMFYSLAVLLIPIALVLTFYRVLFDGDKPISVDPAPAIQQAAQEFTVAEPTGLGDDWHITSAHTRHEDGGVTLRLGFVDPDDDPILLVQSTVPAATLVPAEVGAEGKRIGAFRTTERTWMRYSGRPGETALIFTEQNRTVIIVGKTDQENLDTLAAALS